MLSLTLEIFTLPESSPASDSSVNPGTMSTSRYAYRSSLRAMIAVCTYNEAENIELMVTGLRQALPEADVIVVDDNSPDGTAFLVSEMAKSDASVQVLVRENERGLGSAIRFAMQHSIDQGYDYFMNLDGDLSHSPEQMKLLFSRALEDSALAVVVGSRYVADGEIIGWPLRRKLMSRMVNGFATTFLRLPIRDCSGSMRCYRVTALASLGLENLRVNGYAVLEEVLLRLHQRGERMAEVPITFTERERGYSKLTISEAMRSMLQIISLAFRPKVG